MGDNREDAQDLWNEALEEDSAPAFELQTFDQFIEFIKVGIASLLEHKKLDNVENITDKHKDLIADIGLFVSLYGSYQKWKTERKQLKGKLSQSLNQLKKLTVENKSLSNMKDELEKNSKELELQSAEIDIRKNEFEKSNLQLQSEVDNLIERIATLNKKILELSQFDNDGSDTVTTDQLNNLRNTKIDYELKLSEKQAEIDLLMKEINAVDLQRQRMDEILVEYRTYLRKIDEFKLDFDQVKSVYNNLDRKRLLLIESKKSEEELIEKVNSEIDEKKHEESKVQNELNKFDIEIEKINISKIENQNLFEDKQAEIENAKV
ncbi:MAG: hypothetical protein KAR20_08380, partial [Candidatus Heimdallarchaeota archaeon]|nr:hypothetical protein [Candidatus Heimdallarchaeota archaeon]